MKFFGDDVWSMRASKRALRRKRQRLAALVLAVLVVLGLMVWLAFIGSPWLAVLFAALIFGTAGLALFYAWRAVVIGELPVRFGEITYRRASPVVFWIRIALYVMIATFWFFLGLELLGLAPHWFIALMKSSKSHH